jgi:hypothetical protein
MSVPRNLATATHTIAAHYATKLTGPGIPAAGAVILGRLEKSTKPCQCVLTEAIEGAIHQLISVPRVAKFFFVDSRARHVGRVKQSYIDFSSMW